MEDMGEHRMGGEVGVGCMEGTCRVGLGGGVCIGRGRVVDSMMISLASSSSQAFAFGQVCLTLEWKWRIKQEISQVTHTRAGHKCQSR